MNIKYHGVYLGISYKGSANNITDLNKEIKRNSNNDTICRIIIGGNNQNFKTRISYFKNKQNKKNIFSS